MYFCSFEQDGGGTISQTTMQMILKSMGVKVDKDDLESYAGEADEAGTGKFSFTQFCQAGDQEEKTEF
jgi:Ca2+-binding EF-hand superfamily protein